MNQIKAGALLSYASLFLSNIIGLSYTPFMLRMMGQSEFGLYSLILTVVSTLTLLDVGLGSAVVRYSTKFRDSNELDRKSSMLGMFLSLYSVIGIICLILGFVLSYNLEIFFESSLSVNEIQKARIMTIMITIYLAVSFPLSVFGSLITAYENYIFQKCVNIIRIIALPSIMIPFLLNGYKSLAMASVHISVGIFALVINVLFCFYKLKIRIKFKNYEIKLLKEIGVFSMFVFLKIIFLRITWSTGQFVIGSFLGTAAVAIFAVAIQIRGYFHSFSEALNSLFLPRLTILASQKNSIEIISNLFIKIGRIQMHIIGYLLSVYILFGLDFVIFWAGPDYYDSYLISLIIIVPALVSLIQAVASVLLQARNELKFQAFVYFLMSIITVITSVILTKKMGAIGSAISLGIAIIIGEIFIMNWYYLKKIKLNITKFWIEIIKIIIPIVSFMIVFRLITSNSSSLNIYKLIMNILIYSVFYFPIITFICLNKYEKDLAKNLFLKLNTLLKLKKQ